MDRMRLIPVVVVLLALLGMWAVVGGPLPSTSSGPIVTSGGDEYPHRIVVSNGRADAVELTIVVTQEGDRIYERTHAIPATSERTVAGITRRQLPEDERRLTIVGRLPDGTSANVTVSVTPCLGSVYFSVSESEGIDVTYSIC